MITSREKIPTSIEELVEFSKFFRNELYEFLGDYIDDKVESEKRDVLQESLEYLKSYVLGGGKVLRPLILFLMNKEFRKESNILQVCAGYECIHNYTLIIDDIIDQHEVRRDKETLHVLYRGRNFDGRYSAILSADELSLLGLELLLNAKTPEPFWKECLFAYKDILYTVDQGQQLDLNWRWSGEKPTFSEDDCIYRIELVAAKFLEHMFYLGTLKDRDDFREIGKLIAVGYQLYDDIMDICHPEKKRRPVGSDIREGTPTLLSLAAYNRLERGDKKHFCQLYGNKNIKPNDLDWLLGIFEATGAVKYVKDKVEWYINHAKNMLQDIGIREPHWIHAIADYSMTRRQ